MPITVPHNENTQLFGMIATQNGWNLYGQAPLASEITLESLALIVEQQAREIERLKEQLKAQATKQDLQNLKQELISLFAKSS